jgi:hypothetical protein
MRLARIYTDNSALAIDRFLRQILINGDRAMSAHATHCGSD